MDYRVVVIGAGLSGLALANGLRGLGVEVAVFERDAAPDARPQGYRIQLDEPGLTGLARCLPADLFELCLATAGSPPALVRVFDHQLTAIADRTTDERARSQRSPSYAVNRATLRQILLSNITDNVHFGAEFTSYRQLPDGRIVVRSATGRTHTADVLVGADGVGSTVRGELLPSARVEDAGLRLIYGRVPLAGATLPPWVFDSIFSVVTGPGHTHVGVGPVQLANRPDAVAPALGLTPVEDYLACLVGAAEDHPGLPPYAQLRRLDTAALRTVAECVIGDGWHPDIHHILDHWDTASLFPLRIASALPLPPWHAPGITLVGDAAHAMSPVLAMGANTALRDAGELTGQLSVAGIAPHEALRRYQARMLDYACALVAASRRTGQQRVGQR